MTAWGQLVAGKAQVASAQAQVTASEIALNGVREEAKAGQRTTLDVLNAQRALVNARVALVTAQHDRVVASYAVLNAVGRWSPQVLHLATTVYDPSVHYQEVRDSWFGLPPAAADSLNLSRAEHFQGKAVISPINSGVASLDLHSSKSNYRLTITRA